MSACEVARLDIEVHDGERAVTVMVVDDYQRSSLGLAPSVHDLPDDMRAALLAWLEGDAR